MSFYSVGTRERQTDYSHRSTPVPTVPPNRYPGASSSDYFNRYESLKAQWAAETAHFSLIDDKVASPAFAAIVSMGDIVVPLILRDIRQEPNLLFLALHRITGENPVPPSAAGRIGEIINAWLSWADRNQPYAD